MIYDLTNNNMSLNTMSHDDTESAHECPQAIPSGFSSVAEMNRVYGQNHPTTIQEYAAQGLSVPQPGEYADNNGESGSIVLADYTGAMHVMVPTSNTETNKTRYQQATAKLEQLGYKKSDFFVPFSNPAYEDRANSD